MVVKFCFDTFRTFSSSTACFPAYRYQLLNLWFRLEAGNEELNFARTQRARLRGEFARLEAELQQSTFSVGACHLEILHTGNGDLPGFLEKTP